MNTTATPRATDAQVGFIRTLAHQVGSDRAYQMLVENFSVVAAADLTKGQASRFITMLKEARTAPAEPSTAPAPAPAEPLSVGMYRRDGKTVKVHKSRNGEHLLASVLDPDTGEFTYLGAAYRFVAVEHRMSLEDAEEFSLKITRCCCCGRTLTADESVRLGIGPICRGRYF